MRLDELDFDLPAEAIAQTPAEPRDSCRLMRLAASGEIEHARFFELADMLQPDDLLVLNDSEVLPARVEACRPSGGVAELLFVRPLGDRAEYGGECWEALVRPSRRMKEGSLMLVGESERVVLAASLGEGRWAVRRDGGGPLVPLMERYGRLPLPPYIRTYPDEPSTYQTVYACTPGSAAAPTAGLHFTDDLIERLTLKGVHVASVTLHVGLDTFLPIREDVVEDHRIHTESYTVPTATVEMLKTAMTKGGRVVAVGTTVTRVLETLGREAVLRREEGVRDVSGTTDIYIFPGQEFSVVDSLVTNFHLPRSTVLLMTMAFAGVERLKAAYREAISAGYRFFSFGDAMLIERPRANDDRGSGSSAHS